MRLIDADAIPYEPLPKGDRNYRTYNLDDAYEDGYNDAMVDVRNSPTIEERKTGKWEEIRVMPEAYDITGEKTWASVMCCNKCGFEAFAIEGHFSQYHFCPNCGADMRETP